MTAASATAYSLHSASTLYVESDWVCRASEIHVMTHTAPTHVEGQRPEGRGQWAADQRTN